MTRPSRMRVTPFEAALMLARRGKAASEAGRNEEAQQLYRQALARFGECMGAQARRYEQQCREMLMWIETGSVEQALAVSAPKPPAPPLAKAGADEARELVAAIQEARGHHYEQGIEEGRVERNAGGSR